MTHLLILTMAAFFAGMLNTVAGGGTFLTFPALIYAGIPPVAANATSAVAVFPGYLGGAVGFRKEVAAFDRARLVKMVGVTALGGFVGSVLLLVSSNSAFSAVVPFLLAFAALMFAFGDRLKACVAAPVAPALQQAVIGAVVITVGASMSAVFL